MAKACYFQAAGGELIGNQFHPFSVFFACLKMQSVAPLTRVQQGGWLVGRRVESALDRLGNDSEVHFESAPRQQYPLPPPQGCCGASSPLERSDR